MPTKATAVLFTVPELVLGVPMALQVLRYLVEGRLTVKAVLRDRRASKGPTEGYVHSLDWYKGGDYLRARVSFPPKDGEEDDVRSILMNISVKDGEVWVLPDELQDKDE